MSYKLVIVESPTKVNSIGHYLKDGYKIATSMGHIRDLPAKGGMNIDIENDFKPNYQINPDKKKIVSELKSLAKGASEVIMASDEDREGEAIAWHLCHILKIDPKSTKRIVFHEITADALKEAIANPRYINQDLVNAQQARRILDRIVGFELSPVLWKKVQRDLSAGRVQSVAVRLICDKEEEIKQFKPLISCHGQAVFEIKGQEIKAELKNKMVDLKEGRLFLETCRQAKFNVQEIEIKPSLKNPSAPFKTSSLQQEAAQKLGFSVKQTMVNAQKLYEAGFITYMRTDSLNLSDQALGAAQKYIVKNFGAKYHNLKKYQTKSKDAQEAHEAIRPTDFTTEQPNKVDQQAAKLYKLIWQRTLASQMTAAKTDKTTVTIEIENSDDVFTINGQVLKFDGFLKMTQGALDDVILPEFKIGQELKLLEAHVVEKFSNPPSRFSEASLVKKLEELGIGRPSTYAPTIGTILSRGYVVKDSLEAQSRRYRGIVLTKGKIRDYDSEEKWGGATNKLLPTDIAKIVTPFLKEYFSEIMDYSFTSKIETDFDKIAQGELDWTKHLQTFYDRFHPTIEAIADIPKSKVAGMRELGKDPADNKIIYARLGRFGPMLQKGLAEDSDNKPIFASLPPKTNLEDITLQEALKMFQLPRLLGQTEDGVDILAKLGRFGPYLEVALEPKKLFVPLKEISPFKVELKEALKLIEEKLEVERKKLIADFGDLKIINGPYGPYITDGEKNGKIPKKDENDQAIDPVKITKTQAQEWFEKTAKPARKSKRTRRK